MGKKKIEPTDRMARDAEFVTRLGDEDALGALRAALNHPDAAGLFADEECAQCRLLNTAWHDLARHPAIVPPDWEPGNGQSYAEAVLARLNSRSGEDDRPWEPLNGPVRVGDEVRVERAGLTTTAVVARVDADGEPWTAEGGFIGALRVGTWFVRRAVQELPTEDGAVIVPAEGHEYIEAEVAGQTFIAREAVVCQSDFGPANVLQGAWRRVDDGARSEGQMARHCITPGTWKVDDQ